MNPSRISLLCANLLLLAFPMLSLAQSNTPEAAAQEYYDALYASDWDRLAKSMHPDALQEVVALMEQLAATNKGTRESMEEDFRSFFSLDTLDRVDPHTVYAAFSQVLMSKPLLNAMMQGSSVEALGSVKEGDSVAHVVTRMRVTLDDGETYSQTIEVQSMKLHNGQWLALLGDEYESLKSTLAMFMSMKSGIEDEDEDEDWEDDDDDWDSDEVEQDDDWEGNEF